MWLRLRHPDPGRPPRSCRGDEGRCVNNRQDSSKMFKPVRGRAPRGRARAALALGERLGVPGTRSGLKKLFIGSRTVLAETVLADDTERVQVVDMAVFAAGVRGRVPASLGPARRPGRQQTRLQKCSSRYGGGGARESLGPARRPGAREAQRGSGTRCRC